MISLVMYGTRMINEFWVVDDTTLQLIFTLNKLNIVHFTGRKLNEHYYSIIWNRV